MTRTTGRRIRPGDDHGYPLAEIMIVMCLIAIVAAMAVPVSSSLIQQRKSDSGVVAARSAVTAARDRAIAERRNIQFTFVAPNKIRLSRVEVPSGDLTLVQEFTLQNGQVFVTFDSVPDTPDHFGADSATDFSGTAPHMFTSDGSLIDSNGDIANGTVFIGLPNQIDSARAVTVFGVTRLTRAWKWRGRTWME